MENKKVVNKINPALGNAFHHKHICLFYNSKKDLLELVVPYFKEGLRNNEFCVWVVSGLLGIKDAKAVLSKAVGNLNKYIKEGQLEILNYKDVYLKSGMFNSDRVLKSWAEKEKQALKRGFNGLRVSGDASWLQSKDWEKFVDYEKTIDYVIDKHKITALCTYPLENHDLANMFILSMNHKVAFSNKDGHWHVLKNIKTEWNFKTDRSNVAEKIMP